MYNPSYNQIQLIIKLPKGYVHPRSWLFFPALALALTVAWQVPGSIRWCPLADVSWFVTPLNFFDMRIYVLYIYI